nr:MAG: hypothetical protein [Bacteriophage sp.]
MIKNDNLHILFKTLTDILPYEYNEKFTSGDRSEPSITIIKEGSSRIMYISTDTYNPNDFEVTVYDDDDNPLENFHWATEKPETTIETIIADIKHTL